METIEIIKTNEIEDEVFETFTEASDSRNGFKTVVGIGLAAGLGYFGYKLIVKPIVNKFKNRKEDAKAVSNDEDLGRTVCNDDVDESIEGKN